MKIALDGVAETLFITTRVRAMETKRPDSLLQDPYAVDILDKIDFEESPKNKIAQGTQIGTVVRTLLIDKITSGFIKKHPDGIIINLGCGLDARYNRLCPPNICWYDIDIEESMKVRKLFFEEKENDKMIAKSMLDYTWMDAVPRNKPTLIISEGVMMYFAEKDLKALFLEIFKRFATLEMVFDVLSPSVAKRSNKHPDVKKYNVNFKWGLASANDLKQWNPGIRIISDESYMIQHHVKRWPFVMRLLRWIPAIKNMCRIIHLGYTGGH